MTRRNSEKIEHDCNRLFGFTVALFTQLRARRSLPPEDYERKVSELLAQAPDAATKRRVLTIALTQIVGWTHKLSVTTVSEIDASLFSGGHPTLSDMRKELRVEHPYFL